MKDDLQLLQDQITPEVLGIFWVTSSDLSKKPRPFYALDYFLDGLLTNSKSNKKTAKNFFVTKSFDQLFFVAHIEESSFGQESKEIMSLVENLKAVPKNILYIEETPSKQLQSLNKQFSNFTFKQIELD